jgi:hypothetical protein
MPEIQRSSLKATVMCYEMTFSLTNRYQCFGETCFSFFLVEQQVKWGENNVGKGRPVSSVRKDRGKHKNGEANLHIP